MKKKIVQIFPFLLLLFCSVISNGQNSVKKLVEEQLPSYLINTKQEKVFIQTDREFYQQADTVWFKGSVVNATSHVPVTDEKYLYVDLISPENKVVFHQIYELFNGFTGGYLPIFANAKPGRYQLVSYTNYMKNFSEDFFFRKYIDISGTQIKPIVWDIKEEYLSGSSKNDTLRLFLKTESLSNISSLFEIDLEYNDSVSINKTIEIGEDGIQLDFFVPNYLANSSPIVSIKAYENETITPYKKQLFKEKSKVDIQFLPEGGVFIAGKPNKVAFKATDIYGNPISVGGNIIDGDGNMVANFQTMYNGSGYFLLVPKSETQYTALISYGGYSSPIQLPDVKENGIALSLVKQNKEKILIQLSAQLKEEKSFFLLGHTRGIPYYIKQGSIRNQQGIIEIGKSKFPSGISTFTLFIDGKPRAERLVYIEKNDQLNLQLSFNKNSYKPGDKVDLGIKVTNEINQPVVGSFAIGVSEIRTDKRNIQYSNIKNYLLLSSDLNGSLPDNTEYIDPKNPNRFLYIDLLMMTNGWRRFNWDDVTKDSIPQLNFSKEDFMYLKGVVTKKTDTKPAPPKTEIVAQLKGKNGFFIEQVSTNEIGEYSIKLPDFSGELKLDLLTRSKNGKSKDYNLSLESNVDGFKFNRSSFNKLSEIGTKYVSYLDNLAYKQIVELDTLNIVPIKRRDNYFFPGPDIIEIKQVDVKSKYLNLRDSLFRKSGTPDVVIESTQIEAFAKESSWYNNMWDLLADKIPGLDISQGMYNWNEIKRLKRHSNLLIYDRDTSFLDKDEPIYVTSFQVLDNPESFLIITVDGVFLEGMSVFPYEFFENMDPSEIETINFLAKPENSDLKWLNTEVFGINEDKLMELEENPGFVSDPQGSQVLEDRLRNRTASYLFITTKSGKGPYYTPPVGAITTKLKGLSVYKEFYTPKYNKQDSSDPNNFKKTLFWDANIITDSLGNASASFFANGILKDVFLNIQGVGIDGKAGAYFAPIPLDSKENNLIASNNSISSEELEVEFPEYIIAGKVVDSVTGMPIQMAKINQLDIYKNTISNRDGNFIIDKDEFNSEKLLVSSCGYFDKEININKLEGKDNLIKLNPTKININPIDELPINIVKKAIRNIQSLYYNMQPYKGFSREAMLIDGNVYEIEEVAFNYAVGRTVHQASNKRLEVTGFRTLQDIDGDPMPTVNPNHRELTYPVQMDVLANSPEFLTIELIKEFEWNLKGSILHNKIDCYVIDFDQKADIYHSRDRGRLYIDKSNYAILHVSWEKSPLGIKYLSNTTLLNNTPRNDLKTIKVKNEVNYNYEGEKLIMNSGKKFVSMIADQKHLIEFETETVISGASNISFSETKNQSVEKIILDEKARSFLTKNPEYSYDSWRFRGIIPLPEKYLKDIKFLHESVVYY